MDGQPPAAGLIPPRVAARVDPEGAIRLPLPHDRAAEPPSAYRWLRAHRPVCRVRMPSGDPAWLVTRYRDARFVLSDRRLGKAGLTEPDAPRVRPGTLPPGLLFTTDPPEHTRLRRCTRAVLGTARVAAQRPAIAAAADRLLDALCRAGGADLVAEFAEPLAMQVVCDLLDLPTADRDRFVRWAEVVLAVDGFRPGEVDRAQRDLLGYAAALAEARRAAPGEDAVSAMARYRCPELGNGTLDPVVSLVATILVTGYETMVAAVANALLILLLRDGLPSPWPADSGGLLDELLRLGTFGDALRSRRARTDVRVGGVLVPAGDVVLVSVASANRDEAAFREPDHLIPGRSGPRHLSFGRGIHHCVGAELARVQLDVALERLAARLPGMRLAVAPEAVVLRTGSAERPPARLPVRW
jgi:cytochrome P450